MSTFADPRELAWLVRQFVVAGDSISASRFGAGHINNTYKITLDRAAGPVHCILQHINHEVFKRPWELMENMVRVTEHLRNKLLAAGHADPSRGVLSVIPTRQGRPVLQDDRGRWWRMCPFIQNTTVRQRPADPTDAKQTARAFAKFAADLVDLPGPPLHETIVDFHNATRRLDAFVDAVAKDPRNRATGARPEIAFLQDHAAICDRQGLLNLPRRICHNDCKINNLLVDQSTGQPLCVVDLDTVMPGLCLFDFGDMVRTATASAEEDERDLARVSMRLDMFKGLVRGYLSEAHFLTPAERNELVFAGRLITFEQALRFLTDHLQGDVYYRIHRPDHNLDRCRTQIRMIQSMEAQQADMERVLNEARPDAG